MHRFFFLLIAWILVEAYWLIPLEEKTNMEEWSFTEPAPCLKALDSLDYQQFEFGQLPE